MRGIRCALRKGSRRPRRYFSADVCVGTPAKSFDLIVDTGSSLTAFPCSDCSQCGSHPHADGHSNARYDPSASSTGELLACSSSDCPSHHCSGSGCAYSVSYTEGSSIRGRMVYDTFWFASSAGRRGVRASFGCQTFESGLFRSQVADGITGLSPSRSYGGTLFDWLRRATHAPDIFSICLSQEVGAMVLGGTIPPETERLAQWIPSSNMGSYSV